MVAQSILESSKVLHLRSLRRHRAKGKSLPVTSTEEDKANGASSSSDQSSSQSSSSSKADAASDQKTKQLQADPLYENHPISGQTDGRVNVARIQVPEQNMNGLWILGSYLSACLTGWRIRSQASWERA